jgi:UDP-N-acetylmuramoyl-tripeptide--D-alanyl-D-alanine ligase
VRPRTLAEVAAAVRGRVGGPDDSVQAGPGGRTDGAAARAGRRVTSVTVDSRVAGPGDLFVALPGERADGHRFVARALAAGAGGAMVRAGFEPPAGEEVDRSRLVLVDDPSAALLDLARDERAGIGALVIGITGSTGKTCTKDFAAAVLGTRLRTSASPGSFNNEVGLPLTILNAPAGTEALVCEMGARGAGHIALLCDVARPEVGVVTNVGVAHLGMFGSVQALRDAKAELVEALPEDGAAVLNADDPAVRSFAGRTRARTVLFGTAAGSQVEAHRIEVDRRTGVPTFELLTPGGRATVTLPVPGAHMVSNALAAAAVGWIAGLGPEECAAGLAAAAVSAGRMQAFESPDGIRILDDAYNANPTSMAAALRAARWMAGSGRCIAVLGHMAELGPIAGREHERIGELLARLGIDEVVLVGPEAALIAVGAEREGVEPDRIHRVEDAAGAVEAVRSIARPGDLVLVKASRVARLERVAEALRTDLREARA